MLAGLRYAMPSSSASAVRPITHCTGYRRRGGAPRTACTYGDLGSQPTRSHLRMVGVLLPSARARSPMRQTSISRPVRSRRRLGCRPA